jgi:hypothetical protein
LHIKAKRWQMSREILEVDGQTVGIDFVSKCFNGLAENRSLVTREMGLELPSPERSAQTASPFRFPFLPFHYASPN